MTKHNAAKRAARELALRQGISYTAARRHLGADGARTDRGRVTGLFEFVGDSAPAPLRVDLAPAMSTLRWADIEMLRGDSWTHDPSVPERHELPDLLGTIASSNPNPAAADAHRWVQAHTVRTESSFEVPPTDGSFEWKTIWEDHFHIPLTLTIDAAAAERWLREHRWIHDLRISDLVTPAELREWFTWHEPGVIDCWSGRHYFDGSPSPYAGECIQCGTRMLVRFDGNGEEYEAIVSEDEYLADVAATEAACNWAPPTPILRARRLATTQGDWHENNRPSGYVQRPELAHAFDPAPAADPWALPDKATAATRRGPRRV